MYRAQMRYSDLEKRRAPTAWDERERGEWDSEDALETAIAATTFAVEAHHAEEITAHVVAHWIAANVGEHKTLGRVDVRIIKLGT